MAEAASAVRFPTAVAADSGRVGCAIACLAAANEKGFPCAFAWHPRQVFSVTGRRPAAADFTRSRMIGVRRVLAARAVARLAADALREIVRLATGAPGPPPVAWHFRQAGESCGSSRTPAFVASSAAVGVESTA